MTRYTLWISLGFFVLSALFLYASYVSVGWLQSALLGGFSTFLGASVGLVLVNVLLDKRSRRIATGPLLYLVMGPINRYHDELFLDAGWKKFGKDAFGVRINEFQNNDRLTTAWSPEDRRKMVELVEDQAESITETIDEIDLRLSDLLSVLGWNFDAKIVAAAITAKQEISIFRAATPPSSDEEAQTRVKAYFDIDAAANTVVHRLAEILRISG